MLERRKGDTKLHLLSSMTVLKTTKYSAYYILPIIFFRICNPIAAIRKFWEIETNNIIRYSIFAQHFGLLEISLLCFPLHPTSKCQWIELLLFVFIYFLVLYKKFFLQ